MGRVNQTKALDPFEVRFTNNEDKAKYGDRWYVYDEAALMRLPAQDLIAMETDMDMSIPAMMNGFRQSTVLGDTAAAWVSVRQADPALAGDFDDFNPIWAALEWRLAPKDQPVNEAVPVGSLTAMSSLNTNLVPTATVALPVSLPVE